MKTNLIIGTRQSLLALWQSNHIADLLRRQYPECTVTLKKIITKGDRILDVPLAKIGGKGLFTKELETALLEGEIDLAVHSLKDMPTILPEGLCLTAVTKRANAGDAFVSNKYASIETLPQGSSSGYFQSAPQSPAFGSTPGSENRRFTRQRRYASAEA